MNKIEEIIADAKAEEETKHLFMNECKSNGTVTINLNEYVLLKNQAHDLERLLQVIVNELEINSYNDDLRFDNEREVVKAFKVLFPKAYYEIFKMELKKKEDEKEGE